MGKVESVTLIYHSGCRIIELGVSNSWALAIVEKRMGKIIEKISKKDMDILLSYNWPGNIRELRNIIERGMILSTDSTLPIDIPRIQDHRFYENMALEEVEKGHILRVLEMTDWKVSGKNGAAVKLGLKRSTLESRMAKLGIKRKK